MALLWLMRFTSLMTLLGGLLCLLPLACVDPDDLNPKGTVDIIAVDGTVTNLSEP